MNRPYEPGSWKRGGPILKGILGIWVARHSMYSPGGDIEYTLATCRHMWLQPLALSEWGALLSSFPSCSLHVHLHPAHSVAISASMFLPGTPLGITTLTSRRCHADRSLHWGTPDIVPHTDWIWAQRQSTRTASWRSDAPQVHPFQLQAVTSPRGGFSGSPQRLQRHYAEAAPPTGPLDGLSQGL